MSNILEICTSLQEINQRLAHPGARNLLVSVEEAFKKNTFHLAVLGEFKRGKSSMINSLVGRELLPTDVLPETACVHVLEYGEEESCLIVWDDFTTEPFPLSQDTLARLGAKGDLDSSKVKYILIRLNLPILKQGLTIIDTPGVNDMAKNRAEVTYGILPHCDAALFLLDAAAPLTRSEADFLQNQVLSYQLDTILFILSKADRLDEEELEEALEGATGRLQQVLGRDAELIPYSSREVHKASRERSEHLQSLLSRLSALQEKAKESFLHRQMARLQLAIQLLEEQISICESLEALNKEKIKEYEKALVNGQTVFASKFNQLMISVDHVGRETLEQLIRQSCVKLQEQLADQLRYELRLYDGNLEKFWSQVIPVQIERRLKQYSEGQAIEIQTYLHRFIQHVSKEYHHHFKLDLLLPKLNQLDLPQWKAEIKPHRQAAYQVMEHALPVSAGAIAGSIILPGIGTVVGGAIGSIFSSITKEKKREAIREDLLNEIPMLVRDVISQYERGAIQTVSSWFANITSSLTSFHAEHQDHLKRLVEVNVDAPELENDEGLSREQLEPLRRRLLEFKEALDQEKEFHLA